jgi:hypothetical protein
VFLVSDVKELACYMVETFLSSGLFKRHDIHLSFGSRVAWGEIGGDEEVEEHVHESESNWLRIRPYIVATERDTVCELTWR